MLSFQGEIQRLKGGLVNVEKINQLDVKISKLEKDVTKAQNFVVDQQTLGFSKAFQQAKYFYKIPLDEENFDVGKDLYSL